MLVQTRLLGDLASAVVGARRVIVAIARAPKLEQSVTQGVLVPSIPIVKTIILYYTVLYYYLRYSTDKDKGTVLYYTILYYS